MRSFPLLPVQHTLRLILGLFDEHRRALSILPGFIRPMENWKPTTTSIISSLGLSLKNRAINESPWISPRDVGDYKFARTWISHSSVANMEPKEQTWSWYPRGISM